MASWCKLHKEANPCLYCITLQRATSEETKRPEVALATLRIAAKALVSMLRWHIQHDHRDGWLETRELRAIEALLPSAAAPRRREDW